MFDQRGVRLDPVATVEVVNRTEHFIVCSVDMTADEPVTTGFGRELLHTAFEARDVVHDRLGLGLDRLAQRKIFLAAPGPILVVQPVDPHQRLVADIAQDGDDFTVLGDRIKDVAVQYQVAPFDPEMDVFIGNLKPPEDQWKEAVEYVVVVTAEVDHLDLLLLDFLQDQSDEAGMLGGPSAFAVQRPSVDDVPIEDQLVAMGVLEEMINFVDLAVGRSQMNVGQDDRAESENSFLRCHSDQAVAVAGRGR